MWGCFCSSPETKEEGGKQSSKTVTDSAGSTAGFNGLVRSVTTNSSTPQAKAKAAEIAEENSFQALCKAYERGRFDPSNPSGRVPSRPINSPAFHSTMAPTLRQSRAAVAPTPHAVDPAASSSSSHSTRSDGRSEGAASSASKLRSEASTVGRPQPVHELHELIMTPPEHRSSALLSSTQVRAEKGKLMTATGDTQHSFSRKPHANGLESKRSKSKLNHESMGYPVKRNQPSPRDPSLDLEGFNDPMEGHPHYQLVRPLNPGSSGSVYLCIDLRANDEVAVKMVSRGVSNAKAAEREIANLRLCALHPYIIHMREVFVTSENLAIVFEYAPGGNLANYIETFQSSKVGRGISEERTRWIFQQIVVAVDYCHKMGIANRDIKLENVLLVPCSTDPAKPPLVKLCDFGFSKDENADSLCKTACGTPECVAPEVLTGSLYDGKSSDIWSMGVLLYTMLTGTFPFSRPSDDLLDNTASLRKLFSRIAHSQYPRPAHISRAAQDLLASMLQPEPKDRITIAGILSHPWFGTSLESVALNVNKGLLEMPDNMLTGFAQQSDQAIAAIIQTASQRVSFSLSHNGD